MDQEEARAWLRGQRSMTNTLMDVSDPAQRGYTLALIAEADAAMCQQAYWILRAEAEGIIKSTRAAPDREEE